MRRSILLTIVLAPAVAFAATPGVGVFFKADEAAALREKVQKPPCKAIYEQLLKRANEALAKWPEDKAKLSPTPRRPWTSTPERAPK